MNAICPGCGWIGKAKAKLSCPVCAYENNQPPYRLLTLKELMGDETGVYNDINMGKFLMSVLKEYNKRTVEQNTERNKQ